MTANSLLSRIASAKATLIPEPWVHGVHAGIALAVVLLAHLWLPTWLAAVGMLLVAGGIEFWFDARYEKQPLEDNLHDWEDYLIGVLIAVLIVR